nr:hypothetical protein [Tanacetum cinerariifolium]
MNSCTGIETQLDQGLILRGFIFAFAADCIYIKFVSWELEVNAGEGKRGSTEGVAKKDKRHKFDVKEMLTIQVPLTTEFRRILSVAVSDRSLLATSDNRHPVFVTNPSETTNTDGFPTEMSVAEGLSCSSNPNKE